jgi:hypothetical protein
MVQLLHLVADFLICNLEILFFMCKIIIIINIIILSLIRNVNKLLLQVM